MNVSYSPSTVKKEVGFAAFCSGILCHTVTIRFPGFHVCSHLYLVQPILVRFGHQKCPNIVMAWSWPKRCQIRRGEPFGFGRDRQSKRTIFFMVFGVVLLTNDEMQRQMSLCFPGWFWIVFASKVRCLEHVETNKMIRIAYIVSTSFSNQRTSNLKARWTGLENKVRSGKRTQQIENSPFEDAMSFWKWISIAMLVYGSVVAVAASYL